MAMDTRTSVWKLDTAAQGEGKANNGSQMLVGDLAVTNASNLFTLSGHGYKTGSGPFQLAGTTAPTGSAKLTDYWIIWLSADTFSIASSHANAIAGTVNAITSDGTSVTLTHLPFFDIPIYIKNIVFIGDGTNDGTVTITTKSGGPIIAQAEILSAADAAGANHVVPIYDYVDGVYVNALDAAGCTILVYTGR